MPSRLVFDFVGRFEATPLDKASTRLTHSYRLDLRGPLRLLEPRIERWLAADLRGEMTRLASLLDRLKPV